MAELFASLQAALAQRYTIERELGRGGMAIVYLAQDLRHHRPVAIKVLKPEIAGALGPERFLQEIEIAAGLTHPHILPLHDSGEAAGFLYYVMPYVEGESLRDRLRRERQLPPDDARHIAREVADALSYAHSRHVIHRDVKPENILLGTGHAVVTDFGIARAITAAGGERLTETGITVGTPEYMSPEQTAGEAELDGRADVYSLGCVLYEMLVGKPPFAGLSLQAVVHQHLVAQPPRVAAIRPEVPPGVERAVQRALAKSPGERFATAADFAAALAARDDRPPRNWPRVAQGVAVMVLAVVVVLGVRAALARGPVKASASSIAVIPFAPAVTDTGLARLGRELAITLSANLDGAAARCEQRGAWQPDAAAVEGTTRSRAVRDRRTPPDRARIGDRVPRGSRCTDRLGDLGRLATDMAEGRSAIAEPGCDHYALDFRAPGVPRRRAAPRGLEVRCCCRRVRPRDRGGLELLACVLALSLHQSGVARGTGGHHRPGRLRQPPVPLPAARPIADRGIPHRKPERLGRAAPVVDRAIPRLLARLVGLRRPAHPPGSVHGHRVRRVAGGAGAHATARPRPGRGVDPPDVGGGPPAGYRRDRARAAGADTRVDCSRGRHHRPRYSIGESHYLSSSRSARALGGRFRLSHTRGGCSHDLQWSAPTRRPAHVRVQPSRHRHALPRAPAQASSGHRGGAVARSVARVGGARRVGFCFGCGPAVRERVCHSRRRAGRVPARRGRELAWRGGSCRGSALADGGGRLDRRPDCRAANRGDLAGWLSRDDPGGLPRSRCGAPGARKRRYQGRPNS